MRAPLTLLLLVLLPAVAPAADDIVREATLADAALQSRIHAALVRALTGDGHGAVWEIEVLDRAREAAGQHPTGLRDQIRLLAAGSEPSRDVRRVQLRSVLDDDPDPVVERLARHALEEDDAAAAGKLLSDDRHNRRANLINDAIRPLGVFSGTVFLAALNPFLLAGSAVDSVATTAINLWNYNRLSPREREALVRYRTLIERDARTGDAPEIVHEVQALGRKRAAALCEDLVDRGKDAMEEDDLDAARYYLSRAERLPDCEERLAKPQERLGRELARRAAALEASEWPADHVLFPTSGVEATDYEDLARATVAGDPDVMLTTALRFRDRHPDSRLAPGAALVVAASQDLAGHRTGAREMLEWLADGDTQAGRVARGTLEGPDFGQLDALGAAERKHRREVAKYVLLGNVNGRNALYAAAQIGASGAQAAQSLGVVNVLGMVTRAWQVWRKDPVSNQEIIDRGEELLARTPTGPEANDVHERLATAYERGRNYERALMHYRATTSPDPKRVAKLTNKLAGVLLEQAKQSPAAPLLLTAITRDFKGTDAAKDARKLLDKNPPESDIVLDRELLQEHPALLGPTALDLEPGLLDGAAENGELDDKGVRLGKGQLRLFLRRPGDPTEREETRQLTDAQFARARAAAEETLYTKLLTTEERDPEAGRFERYLPVYLTGSIGESGVSLAPGIKTRPYRSPDRQLYE
jgi:hypothetical protein